MPLPERKILKIGRIGCNHMFERTTNQEWKENGWQYYGNIERCQLCGQEELCGGTILVPESRDFFGGEYVLEPDGSRGMWIS